MKTFCRLYRLLQTVGEPISQGQLSYYYKRDYFPVLASSCLLQLVKIIYIHYLEAETQTLSV